MAERLASIIVTEKDPLNCIFYFKTGACRHGDRCSRLHTKPSISPTLLFSNMYQRPSQRHAMDPRKIQQQFEEFYEDLYEMLSKYGEIESLNVCDNLVHHMEGNVYVQFREEEHAANALQNLSGRNYAGRPIIVDFSPVTDFDEARCRQYRAKQCKRVGHCNLMHLKTISWEFRRHLNKKYGRKHSSSRSRSQSPYRHRTYEQQSHRGRVYGRRYDDRDHHHQDDRARKTRSPRRTNRSPVTEGHHHQYDRSRKTRSRSHGEMRNRSPVREGHRNHYDQSPYRHRTYEQQSHGGPVYGRRYDDRDHHHQDDRARKTRSPGRTNRSPVTEGHHHQYDRSRKTRSRSHEGMRYRSPVREGHRNHYDQSPYSRVYGRRYDDRDHHHQDDRARKTRSPGRTNRSPVTEGHHHQYDRSRKTRSRSHGGMRNRSPVREGHHNHYDQSPYRHRTYEQQSHGGRVYGRRYDDRDHHHQDDPRRKNREQSHGGHVYGRRYDDRDHHHHDDRARKTRSPGRKNQQQSHGGHVYGRRYDDRDHHHQDDGTRKTRSPGRTNRSPVTEDHHHQDDQSRKTSSRSPGGRRNRSPVREGHHHNDDQQERLGAESPEGEHEEGEVW
ncbi:hypothetical protein HHK36_011313 [Tetracentron sinense]|uniref:Uncharacterized protein n=1 Tax=Tetracentron sinense TaxID=13715 RepID=A0A834Z905_TETSI|nr:hypothetical protein HHK36_011313 [Tetracentron sinense]